MKLVLLSLLVAIGLVGCGETEPETVPKVEPETATELPNEVAIDGFEARIYTDQETYSLPVEEITVTVENLGQETVNTGAPLRLEKLQEGSWEVIQFNDLEFIMEIVNIAPGDTFAKPLPIDFLADPLEPGQYRVIKEVMTDSQKLEPGEEIAAVFEVSE